MAGRIKHEIPARLAEFQNTIDTLGRMPMVGISGGQDILLSVMKRYLNHFIDTFGISLHRVV